MKNTYILQIYNTKGYEWVPREGATEIIEAESLDKALDSFYMLETVRDLLGDDLDSLESPSEDLLPLDIIIREIPAMGREIPERDVQLAIDKKIEGYRQQAKKLHADHLKAHKNKQKAVKKLKAEAKKLGLSLKDLRD